MAAIDLRNINSIAPNGTGTIAVPGSVDITGTPAPQYMVNGVPLGAAGANGNVQYNNNGSFAGSANLFWDNANSRLGIGTQSPQYVLDVYTPPTGYGMRASDSATPSQGVFLQGIGIQARGFISSGIYGNYQELDIDGNPLLLCRRDVSNGTVGIGMAPPAFPKYKLDVWQEININGDPTVGGLGFLSFASINNPQTDQRVTMITAQTEISHDSGVLIFQTASAGVMSERMRINSQGRVGIQTTNPQAALDVAGTIAANLPTADPGAGSRQLWADPADGYRVKYAA